MNFPKVVYKKLMNEPVGLEDLEEFEPEIYISMKNTLKLEEGFEDMGLTFSITYDNFGAEQVEDLIENGREIAVTKENKGEFVDLYVDWYLNQSVEAQFGPFRTGFYKVMSEESMKVI